MATGNRDRLARHTSPQFQKRDNRSGEGDRANEDADKDLDLVNQLSLIRDLDARFDVAGDSDQDRGQADEAVQHRDQFGHARHRHAGGQHRADHDRRNDPDRHRSESAGHDAKDGGSNRQQHADDAQQVASPRGGLIRQAGQAEDEQHCRHDVGDGRHRLIDRASSPLAKSSP